jgi:hypothetical protein
MKPEEPSLSQQAETALQEAVKQVIEEARRTQGSVVVWDRGAVHQISGDQLPTTIEHAANNFEKGRK